MMNTQFVDERDWEIYDEELMKLGLSRTDVNKKREIGAKLASGLKGEEYKKLLEEHAALKRLLKIAHMKASGRILIIRAAEVEL